MRGIVFDGTNTEFVDGLSVRPPGPRDVIVEIGAAGLCHSDISYMHGLYPVPSPGVCGHEGAGVVAEVGAAVTHVQPGDHVIIATLAACGFCDRCADGKPTACRQTLANWSQPFTLDGEPIYNFAATSAFAERTVVRDVQCVKIPDDVPLTSAALVGCGVVTGMGAVFNRATVQRGQSAAVFGVGGVGLNVIQALKVQGAATIIAIDTVAAKEPLARQFGATHFLDGSRDDLVAAIGEITPWNADMVRGPFNGGGVNWAFDCVANPVVTYNALESLEWEGTVVVIGVSGQTSEFHGLYGRLTQVDRGIIGCRYGTISPHRDIPRIIDLYRRGEVLLDELVSQTFPVEEWQSAVRGLEAGTVAGRADVLMEGLIDTRGKTLWQLITARAEATPNKQMALDEFDRTLTFGEYREWSERVAAGLAGQGIGVGTNVSWILPSRFEALVLVGALSRLGAVQNPILPMYRTREVEFITRQSNCSVIVVPGTFRDFDYEAMAREATAGRGVNVLVADPALPEGDPETLAPYMPAFADLRWLFYSSGTTADPKGAKHSDRSMSAANDGMQWSMQVGPHDKAAVVFPITHVGGLVWLFNAMQTGVELLMVETFNPTQSPAWLGARGVTCAGAGTVFWLAYLNAQRQLPEGERLLPDVRIFNGGGAPKPKTLHAAMMAELGAPVIGGWGMTESPINTMVHVDDSDVKKAETDGRPCPGVELRVVMDGKLCAANEEGELRVKGPQVCMGYLDASLDADAFDPDGWFRTGDLGIVDDDGWVSITGRLKDIIIRKGENISAKEIEDLLHAHPAIADAAVIGLPDATSGERACAVVVLRDDHTVSLTEIVQYLRAQQLSMHKIPEQLEIVPALPRNPTGKVLKKDLRATYGGTQLGGTA